MKWKKQQRKWLCRIALTAILFSCNIYTDCQNGGAYIVNGSEYRTAEVRLKEQLNEAVEDYINLGQRIKTAPYYDNETALKLVLEHEEAIHAASEKYGVEEAMIQAVLFQEIRFYGIDDPVADWLAQASGRYDSSTGLGQVRAATAIDAYNWMYDTHYDLSDERDLESFWKKLQDDSCNIDIVALQLHRLEVKYQLQGNTTGEQLQEIFAGYNGGGGWAERYGQVVYQYHCAFQEYDAASQR